MGNISAQVRTLATSCAVPAGRGRWKNQRCSPRAIPRRGANNVATSVRHGAHAPGRKPRHDLNGTEILELPISKVPQSSLQRLGFPVTAEHLADAQDSRGQLIVYGTGGFR